MAHGSKWKKLYEGVASEIKIHDKRRKKSYYELRYKGGM